jgi:hypothetical protein
METLPAPTVLNTHEERGATFTVLHELLETGYIHYFLHTIPIHTFSRNTELYLTICYKFITLDSAEKKLS